MFNSSVRSSVSGGSVNSSIRSDGTNVDLTASGNNLVPPPSQPQPVRASNTADDLINSAAEAVGIDKGSIDLIKYALMSIGAVAVFKVISESLFYIYVLFLPALYLYLVQTCPKQDSFIVKEELKRVLGESTLLGGGTTTTSGDNNTQDIKRKSFFERIYTQAVAEVTAEYSAWMGMTTDFTPMAGVAIWVTVSVPTLNYQGNWVGINNKWHFVSGRTSSTSNPSAGSAGTGSTTTTPPPTSSFIFSGSRTEGKK